MPETLLNIEDEVTQILSDLGVTTKLNEMDDFMNQNELKVQITNENAMVTGLVTYTCTVKDKDNSALANRIVEWYKGTTLVGLHATDSNGIATFSHRVAEADIYDVHALVRGTNAGDDIRMFVKDKDNILTHTQWSCGEFSNTVPGFNHVRAELSLNSDWCSKGDVSLKAVNLQNQNDGYIYITLNAEEYDAYTFNCKINNQGETSSVRLQALDSEDSASNLITVSTPTKQITPVELTGNIPEGYSKIRITIHCVHGVVYIDDLCLKKINM